MYLCVIFTAFMFHRFEFHYGVVILFCNIQKLVDELSIKLPQLSN